MQLKWHTKYKCSSKKVRILLPSLHLIHCSFFTHFSCALFLKIRPSIIIATFQLAASTLLSMLAICPTKNSSISLAHFSHCLNITSSWILAMSSSYNRTGFRSLELDSSLYGIKFYTFESNYITQSCVNVAIRSNIKF